MGQLVRIKVKVRLGLGIYLFGLIMFGLLIFLAKVYFLIKVPSFRSFFVKHSYLMIFVKKISLIIDIYQNKPVKKDRHFIDNY